jgi:hypothetical protein
MALITFDHNPKFVSFNHPADAEEVSRLLPHRTTVSVAPREGEGMRGRRMHAWCHAHCKGRYGRIWQSNDVVVMFELLEDALMFKLVWA